MGAQEYRDNLQKLLAMVPRVLAPGGEFLWLTTPPGRIVEQKIS